MNDDDDSVCSCFGFEEGKLYGDRWCKRKRKVLEEKQNIQSPIKRYQFGSVNSKS